MRSGSAEAVAQVSRSGTIHVGISLMVLNRPSQDIEILMGIFLSSNICNIKVNIEDNNNVDES